MNRTGRRGQEPWSFTWHDKESNQSFSGTIAGIDTHAHLVVLVPNTGQRFVITDLSAEHRNSDRILIYEPSGKLIRSLGISDILLFHERGTISHSISHTDWVGYDPDRKRSVWLGEDGASLSLVTNEKAIANISLQNGRVTRQPWTMELLRNTPWLWLMATFGLLLARALPINYEDAVRLSLALSIAIVGMLGIIVWAVWRNDSGIIYGTNNLRVLRPAILAAGSVILCWLFLGRTGWIANSITIGIGLLASAIAVALTYGTDVQALTRTVLGTVGGLIVFLSAIGWSGYRLRKLDHSSTATEQPATRPARQFGMIHVLISLGFLAVCMAIVRLHVFNLASRQPGLHQTLEGILLACFATAITWTALTGRNWDLIRCGLIIAVAVAALTFAPSMFYWKGFYTYYWRGLACYIAILFALMLIIRFHGYRLSLVPQPADDLCAPSG